VHPILVQLREDHGHIRQLLRLLDPAPKPVDRVYLQRAADVMRYMTGYPDQFHHPREDLMFGPLAERDAASCDLVGRLREEHVSMGGKGLALREALLAWLDTDTVPVREVTGMVGDYVGVQHAHMNLEEQSAFSKARLVLTDEDWSGIDTLLASRPDPLFGKHVQRSFRDLREYLTGNAGD
jgi:hemerythrin-like domain-containing protein